MFTLLELSKTVLKIKRKATEIKWNLNRMDIAFWHHGLDMMTEANGESQLQSVQWYGLESNSTIPQTNKPTHASWTVIEMNTKISFSILEIETMLCWDASLFHILSRNAKIKSHHFYPSVLTEWWERNLLMGKCLAFRYYEVLWGCRQNTLGVSETSVMGWWLA